MKKYFAFVLIGISFLGCSMKDAQVDTAPPKTEKTIFRLNDFKGDFKQMGTPFVFLWPIERNGQAMTHQEQVDSRTKIVTNKTIVDTLTPLIVEKTKELQTAILPLETIFIDQECSKLCNPEDFFNCDLDVPANAEPVEDWKDPVDAVEEQKILTCQKNQEDRSLIKNDFDIEMKPLMDQQIAASQALILEIGDVNMRPDFVAYDMDLTNEDPMIELSFQGAEFSSNQEDPLLKVKNIVLDRVEGFLTFDVAHLKPAELSPEGFVEAGNYAFSLELSSKLDIISIGGGFVFTDSETGLARNGRVSISGSVQ